MTVYVDNAFIQATVPNGSRNITSRWCHLMADTRLELMKFAIVELRLNGSWVQNKRSGVHFDVTESKRRLAVARGAVEIEMRTPEWFRVVAQAREQYKELGR